MANRLFETYKNFVILLGSHIYAIEYGTAINTICASPPSQHELPHWKYVLRCCYNYPLIDFPFQESDRNNSNTSTSVSFHIYY